MTITTFNGTTEDGYCTTGFGPAKTSSTMLVGANSSDSQDSDSAEYHSFMFFNTAALPNDAVVSQVKLTIRVTSIQGVHSNLLLNAYIGDNIIGSTLETSDYNDVVNGGELLEQSASSTGTKTFRSTDSAVTGEVSLTAYTNIEIDAYWYGTAGSSGVIASIATQEYSTAAYRPQLEVTYTVPSSFVPKVMIF